MTDKMTWYELGSPDAPPRTEVAWTRVPVRVVCRNNTTRVVPQLRRSLYVRQVRAAKNEGGRIFLSYRYRYGGVL